MAAALSGALALTGRPAAALAPLAYPGSLWGDFYREFNGFDGTGIQGRLTQGVDWARLPYGVTFNTFGSYSWRFRTLNKDYFDAHGPAVGALLRRGPVGAGMDYTWLEYPRLNRSSRSLEFFADWYKAWELGGPSWRGPVVKGLPLSTWGRMSYDLEGLEGAGSMGWVKQGVRWLELPHEAGLVAFASYNWRLRSLNHQYYNSHGPSLGVEVSQRYASLGIEYDWRAFPALNRSTRSLQLYLTWYFDWDLKRP